MVKFKLLNKIAYKVFTFILILIQSFSIKKYSFCFLIVFSKSCIKFASFFKISNAILWIIQSKIKLRSIFKLFINVAISDRIKK